METINNWSKTDKDKLKEFIIENIECNYADIVIGGSRAFGGFHPKSDIDVIVYTNEYENKDRVRTYFNSVENPENEYNNFRVNIAFKSDEDIQNDKWLSAKINYDMPRYSLVSEKWYNGNENHIVHHKGLRDLIKKHEGWDVPIDKYLKENKYLIN